MDQVPIRARQSAMFQRCKKKGLMGKKGQNTRMFTQDLLFELTQSGWSSLLTDHFGCLVWLEDLETNDPNQRELANKIHAHWDRADKRKETFTVLDCQCIALALGSRVCEVEWTMGGWTLLDLSALLHLILQSWKEFPWNGRSDGGRFEVEQLWLLIQLIQLFLSLLKFPDSGSPHDKFNRYLVFTLSN